MNTAPKLQHIEVLRDIQNEYRAYDNAHHQVAALDAAIAALAPPSGEGVDTRVAFERWVAKRWGCANDKWADSGEYKYNDTRNWWQCWQAAIASSITTPQSAPVDGDAVQQALLVINDAENDARHRGDYARANALVRARVTLYRASATPPPASQERGGDSIVLDAYQLRCAAEFAAPDYEQDEDQRGTELIFQSLPERVIDGETLPSGMYCWYADYPEEGVMHLEEYEEYEARMTKVASPPSSAAEHRLEMFTKSPGLHEAGCPLSGTPNLYASCDCGLGAAEQAKPDDNMQLRARVAGELIAARDTEDGCNRIMALIATLDTYTAQTECVAAMYPAEQAQAGEHCPKCNFTMSGLGYCANCAGTDAAMALKRFDFVAIDPGKSGNWKPAEFESDEGKWVRYDDCANACRLAGGVTVDDAMTKRALNAQPFTDSNSAIRVWQLLSVSGGEAPDVMRAALIAALGAK